MTRKLALDALRVAGFEHDRRAFTRLYIENRVSIQAAERAFREGRRLAESKARRTGARVERAAP